jgi:hypothetical protein
VLVGEIADLDADHPRRQAVERGHREPEPDGGGTDAAVALLAEHAAQIGARGQRAVIHHPGHGLYGIELAEVQLHDEPH